MREIDVFPPIAALEFLERRFRLVITRLGGGDFFRPIAMMQFVQFVLGVLLLRQRNSPSGLRGIALLLGD